MPAFTAKSEHSYIPVERFQGETHDFIGSKTEPREQQNDGVISLTNGRLAITAGQHRMNLVWRKELRNRRTPPRGYPGNDGGQILRDFSLLAKETEKATQGGSQQLGTTRTQKKSMATNKSDHLIGTQLRAIDGTLRERIEEKLPNDG